MKPFIVMVCIAISACSKNEANSRTQGAQDVQTEAPFELVADGLQFPVTLPSSFVTGLNSELRAAYNAKEEWIDGEDFIYYPIYAHISGPKEQLIVSDKFLIINENNKWTKMQGPFATAIRDYIRDFPNGRLKGPELDKARNELIAKLEAFRSSR